MDCSSGVTTLAQPTGTEFAQTDLDQIPLDHPVGCRSLDADLECVRRKLTLNIEQVEQPGPRFDTQLFVGTMLRLVKSPGR
jgi:hypothetical protein